MPTLSLSTEIQAVLFEHELQGQISDGFWENARPYNHHIPWSCNIDVSNVPGRNFSVIKDNYNFNSSELLSYVGDQMLQKARVCKVLGRAAVEDLHYVLDGGKVTIPTHQGKYYDSVREKLSNYNINEINQIANSENIYNMKDLRNDLRSIKAQIKIRK